jgi:hypothetical protein
VAAIISAQGKIVAQPLPLRAIFVFLGEEICAVDLIVGGVFLTADRRTADRSRQESIR